MHAELASTRFTRKSTDIRIRGGILRGIMVSSFLLRSAPAYTEKSADRVECRGLRLGTLPHHRTCGFLAYGG